MKLFLTEHPCEPKIVQGSVMLRENTKIDLVVIEGKFVSHGYVIPKDKVENYNGRELSLKMRYDEISSDYEF